MRGFFLRALYWFVLCTVHNAQRKYVAYRAPPALHIVDQLCL